MKNIIQQFINYFSRQLNWSIPNHSWSNKKNDRWPSEFNGDKKLTDELRLNWKRIKENTWCVDLDKCESEKEHEKDKEESTLVGYQKKFKGIYNVFNKFDHKKVDYRK